MEIKIADDGEILVRGENVTTGYYETGIRIGEPASSGEAAGRTIDAAGWLHTGDIGEKDAQGRLFIRGRKKEMIVTPEGLNVFPDDVERPLNAQPGRDRVGGRRQGRRRRESSKECMRCWCSIREWILKPSFARANAQLADHQRIRSFSIWTDGPLPRTDGTKKLKRAAIKQWVASGALRRAAVRG